MRDVRYLLVFAFVDFFFFRHRFFFVVVAAHSKNIRLIQCKNMQ